MTDDLKDRLSRHNRAIDSHTAKHRPWLVKNSPQPSPPIQLAEREQKWWAGDGFLNLSRGEVVLLFKRMNQPNAPGSLAPPAKRGERVRERGSRSHPARTQINPKTEMERVKMRQDSGAEILWTIPKAVWWGGGFHRAFLEIQKDAVFVPTRVWLGATREHTPRGSATDEQQRQAELGAKTLRATALLPLGFVVAVVTARHGDAPTVPPRPRPKSPVAAPFPIIRQALSVCAR